MLRKILPFFTINNLGIQFLHIHGSDKMCSALIVNPTSIEESIEREREREREGERELESIASLIYGNWLQNKFAKQN